MKRITWFIALLAIVVGFGTSAYAYQALVGPTGVLLYKSKARRTKATRCLRPSRARRPI